MKHSLFICMFLFVTIYNISSSFAEISLENEKWMGNFTLSSKFGPNRDIGETQLFLPIAQTSDRLLFTDLRLRTDKGTGWEGNLGLGHREIINNQWIRGFYGFLDCRKSPYGNIFRQLTLGAELLTTHWDLRGNLYLPENKTRDISLDKTVVQTGTQHFVIHTRRQEKSARGLDFEIGTLLPFTGRDIRVFAAGYHFDAQDSQNVTGGRLRAQWSFNDIALFPNISPFTFRLHLETQYDDVRKKNHFAGGEISIPFGKANKRRKLTVLERRMTTPIIRDIDIVAPTSAAVSSFPARAIIHGKSLSAVHTIEVATPAELQSVLSNLPSDSLVFIKSNNALTFDSTITLKEGQSLVGGIPGFSVQETDVIVHTSSSNNVLELVRSNTLLGNSLPLIAFKENGSHLIENLRLTNENASSGSLIPMISNNSKNFDTVTVEKVSSTDHVLADITAGSSKVTIKNSQLHGAVLRTRNASAMTVDIQNNTFDRQLAVAVTFNQNITSSTFIESLNTSSMTVSNVSNNTFRDTKSKVGGRAALGLGFLNSSTTDMIINKITNNNVSRSTGTWDSGSYLVQGRSATQIIRVNEVHDNSSDGNFETLNSRINIGFSGVTANTSGFNNANKSNIVLYGNVQFTNNLP